MSACNNNLELAVSLYMDDPSRVPPQSSTEEYRTPIPQRNEQLLPVVVPLRKLINLFVNIYSIVT
ncbi:unnamed protein product [Schistosoma mattheei]|uniref:Uncharacterized protein n=1 Tax=Schistosoma mattheei TaxID=31246 RepID=A0A3P8GB49_9TREM|nr:unnamed protein product [Schistosoma mattheei]